MVRAGYPPDAKLWPNFDDHMSKISKDASELEKLRESVRDIKKVINAGLKES